MLESQFILCMVTVPYSLLCVKIETGFFFALLILPKLRRYFAAEQQVRAFLIFAVLDIVQHPLEVLPSLDVLAGKALVRILPGNDHILVCRILPQLVTLAPGSQCQKERQNIEGLYSRHPDVVLQEVSRRWTRISSRQQVYQRAKSRSASRAWQEPRR